MSAAAAGRRKSPACWDGLGPTVAKEWLENVKPKWLAVYHRDNTTRFETYEFLMLLTQPAAHRWP